MSAPRAQYARDAQRLRDIRTRAGLTQAQLAQKARLNPCVISFYECGLRAPGLKNLKKLVRVLGFDVLGFDAPAPATPTCGAFCPVFDRRKEKCTLTRAHVGAHSWQGAV